MNLEKVPSIPFPIIVTDEKNRIIDFNPTVSEVLYFKVQKGLLLDDLFDDLQRRDEFLLGFLNGEKYLLLSTNYQANEPSYSFHIVVNGNHYVELLEKVKELDKYNRELDAIIESSYDGFYITDSEGTTLQANSAIERITGIPKEYYIGKNINYLLKKGILTESVTLKVLEKKEAVTVVQKNHNQKEMMLTGSPIYNEDGEIEKVVTNIRDLSELNNLHSELKKIQELNDKYKHELERLKAHKHQDPEVVLKSDKMQELFSVAERLADVDATVLVLGETGVGKDVFTRHLYRVSNRFDTGKLIKVNCGAIPKDLLESELFGYEGGAFSGANRSGKPGMFELADRGFLFLDEVGELSLDLQVKLLRVLQEKEIQRVGGTTVKKVDVRVIAATNKDLKRMAEEGHFREDLYYRLHVVPVSIPPLRERRDDILPLVQHFLQQNNSKYKISKSFDKSLKEFFYYYDWPGNVRELANLVERLMLTIPANELSVRDLPDDYQKREKREVVHVEQELSTLKDAVEDAEREVLTLASERFQTTYEMAKHLGTSQATVVRKLQKYKIKLN
ncbi:Fis family transcriptional regulator [Alkalihalophilus pseudofirmus]|nr:Fis family transcriptional regulator [Alkalihalophilus pseudofirmus]